MIGMFSGLKRLSPQKCSIRCRERNRRGEMEKLLAEGQVPHQVDLERHPEKQIPGQRCRPITPILSPLSSTYSSIILGLMGRVAGSIKVFCPLSTTLLKILTDLSGYQTREGNVSLFAPLQPYLYLPYVFSVDELILTAKRSIDAAKAFEIIKPKAKL